MPRSDSPPSSISQPTSWRCNGPRFHKVADTIGKGLIDKDLVTPAVVFGALVGAMFWNVVTWIKGIPSSSSHALVGGLIGAGVAHANIDAIQWSGLNKTLIAIVLSPTLGLILTMVIMLATSWLGVRASATGAERTFRGLHLVSAGAYSLGHGLNDAQKTMGIITVLLYSTGYLHGDFHVPHWVALSCYVAIGLGTLTGGWRIIETMGTRITKLNQHQGFSASAGGSIMLFAASYLGIPVSTTHTITGCVIGAGAARRASAVRWGIARNVDGRVDHHHPRISNRGRALLLADQRLCRPRPDGLGGDRAGGVSRGRLAGVPAEPRRLGRTRRRSPAPALSLPPWSVAYASLN